MKLALTLALAALAGAALWALGGPAPFIVGPVVVSAALHARGAGARPPPLLRDAAFCATGFAMGMGADQQSLARMAALPVSLIALLLCLLAIMATSSTLLRRLRGLDRATAVLAATPGALSYVLAVGERRGADMRALSLLQTMRLVLLVVGLPLILGGAAQLGAGPDLTPAAALSGAALACAAGWLTTRLGMPGGVFIGALASGAALSVGGLVVGSVPMWMIAPAFTVMGVSIGSTFDGLRLSETLRAAGATALVVGVAAALSAGFAALVSTLIAQPFGAVWVAFAPGGAEAMGAVGLALGYDPGFVAAHHMARMFMLAALLPLLLKFGARG